jgi:hypothetical protein
MNMARDLTFGHLSTDSTFASNSDYKVPSQKAVKSAIDGKQATLTKGALAVASGLTVTSNSQSIIGSTVTVSIESRAGIVVGSGLTVSENSQSVLGSTVTVSLESQQSFDTLTLAKGLVYSNQVDVATLTSSGTTGMVVFGTTSIFVCTGTDTWKKVDYS